MGQEARASAAAVESGAAAAGAKSREVIETLKNVGAQFSAFAAAKAAEFEQLANRETKAMSGVAQYANKLANEARTAIDAFAKQHGEMTGAKPAQGPSVAATEEFLGQAGYIIEKLGSLSIDLSRILSPDVGQELWNKYNAGHRSAFAKYLADTLSKRQAAALQSLLKSSPDFRAHAKNYVAEFDSLMLRARGADKSEILLATITSSDIGKAYMILKEIL
jgi:hypothetical protein